MASRLNNNKVKTRDDDSFKRKANTRQEFSEDRYKHLCFNFKYIDKNQGQTFEEWEEEKLLSIMMERFKHLSDNNIMEAQKGILTLYGEFSIKSNYKYPSYIPDNVNWASIRLQNKERVIGFVKDNIFYVVFLDKNHEFWLSEKRNT